MIHTQPHESVPLLVLSSGSWRECFFPVFLLAISATKEKDYGAQYLFQLLGCIQDADFAEKGDSD